MSSIYCERCEGKGEIVKKFYPATWTGPAETVMEDCSACGGEAWACYFCEGGERAGCMAEAHDAEDPGCGARDRRGSCRHEAHDACRERAAELAQDRAAEDFYGGSGPVTMAEREAADRERSPR